VTAIKQFTAKLYYDNTLLQFMKLQAADDILTQQRHVVQIQAKCMIYLIF